MKNFNELVKTQSDNELLTVYVIRGEYQPEYIRLVEEEIVARDLFAQRLGIKHPEEMSDEEIVSLIRQYLAFEKKKEEVLEKMLMKSDSLSGRRIVNYLLDMIIIIAVSVMCGIKWNFDDDLFQIFFITLFVVYYTLFEGLTGRTIAKYVTNTRVVTKEGRIPSYLNIVGRTFCRLIPFDALSFFWGGNWHDKISGTIVILNLPEEDEVSVTK